MAELLERMSFKIKQMNKLQSHETQSQLITEIRKSYIDARNSIRDLDRSLYLVQFLDSVSTILNLMLYIFMITNGNGISNFNTYLTQSILGTTLNVIKLVITCLIHDTVYGENEKLFLSLDELDVKAMNDIGYKEALYFKTYSDSKFGFTIAGTIPYKKTTLLSVSFTVPLNLAIIFIAFHFIIDILFRIELFCYFITEWKKLNEDFYEIMNFFFF